ncbi:ferritin-like domain-containing protein [Mucilaginibacter sp. 21P]|uniref:YciE/YciF ferroxidase family protein n=1 Tax=Mucilaginibacter sp. 21P TaxID=2778902 RepID=UPI001C5797B1|nr:ferritin-like domain-containing protein [Mucilaginibacter sp. 21P]QXV64701.1 ferritin-like domain-containing protein [Mucilaginibacter sp. 21P]
MKKESGEPKFSTKTSPTDQPALLGLFVDGIKDIYWAENHLVKNLPKMIESATSKSLANGITDHLEETKNHVYRLEQVFELLGEKVQAQKCDAMEGLTKEGESIIESTESGTATRDVGIILASQKVEHYEIATYGGLHQLAITLGLDNIAALLAETLAEEKAADEKLTQVAENDINYTAANEA